MRLIGKQYLEEEAKVFKLEKSGLFQFVGDKVDTCIHLSMYVYVAWKLRKIGSVRPKMCM